MEREISEEKMDTFESDTTEANNINTAQTMQLEAGINEFEGDDRSEATFSFRVENFSKLTESTFSPPYYVRNLPWKIMVLPRQDNASRQPASFGFFLQCNGENDSPSWTCNAVAQLRMKSFRNQPDFTRRIKHVFSSKENDWGFQIFMSWPEIENGYIENDAILLEVHVMAEAPHGLLWDSRKYTGYVGIKNQGATCYMNSLLQTLFFTNQLRKAVYKMPTEADDSNKSVALALQRVFHDLQSSPKPVATKKLTKSFGWDTLDSFMQHDVQEFLRVLLDKLESKMKGTSLEGTIPKLFEGKMLSYIRCKNVQYTSERRETFYDIQLSVKGMKNIYESFKDYIATETLDGDNKYDAGQHGLQDAEKGVKFLTFPPVLHLHLMRFQYDPITDNSVKFNDRYEFYETIDLDDYLAEKESTDATYKLHAVLVHSGDNHGGHYVVYINTKLSNSAEGKWCKFDDDVVSKCSKLEAIDHNFGGKDDEMSLNDKQNSNAYMLVYIRASEIDKVLQDISTNDIPLELSERLDEEKRLESLKRSERSETNAFAAVHVLLEEYFEVHQTSGLFEFDDARFRIFKVKKSQLVSEFIAMLSATFKVPQERMRIWTLVECNQVIRPIFFNFMEELGNTLTKTIEYTPWIFLLEIVPADSINSLPMFDKRRDLVIFMKFYDPVKKHLSYIGFYQYQLTTKIVKLIPDVNERLGLPADTELSVYHEVDCKELQKFNNLNDTLEKALKALRDEVQAIYLIFEKKNCAEKLELATVESYFQDQLYKTDVTFVDKNNPRDKGFTLELSQRNNYNQMARAVARRINSDPFEIQFFKCQSYKELPGHPISCSYDGILRDILAYSKPKSKKIFYQKISTNINELENKMQFKCLWISPNLKDEKELVLYLDKCSTVKNLLEEGAKHVEFSENSTRKLRIIEILGHKIYSGPSEDTPIDKLQSSYDLPLSSQIDKKLFRIEEVLADEMQIAEDEILIPVSHFSKEIYNSFGVPFYIKAKIGEKFESLKQRIQKKLNVPEKEWKLYKFFIIGRGQAELISDDEIKVNGDDFVKSTEGGVPLPYLGLEHVNKSQKRSHYNLLEKAIKIFN